MSSTPEKVAVITKTTYAELDEATAPIGGMMGIPQLVTLVGSLLPGGAKLPPEWGEWLSQRITAREPFVLSAESPTHVWKLEIA